MAVEFNSSFIDNHILEQAQRDAWSRLPEQQRQALLYHAASSSGFDVAAQPAIAHQVPRSMSYGSSITQTPTPEPNTMDRSHSAPVPMDRTVSTQSAYGSNHNLLYQRSTSVSSWQQSSEDQAASEYTLSSRPAPVSANTPLHTIDEAALFDNSGIHEYTPEQYINTCIQTSNPISSLPPSHIDPSTRLQVAQLTQGSQWGSSYDGSVSPSTPSTVALTTPTLSSSGMSRQSSYNPQFLVDNVSMLNFTSEFSDVYTPFPEDGVISLSSDSCKTISARSDNSHLLAFTGPPSEDLFPTEHLSCSSAQALTPSSQNQLDLAEDMRRSASASSDDSSSSASATSLRSRQQRREQEIRAQASHTKIAPAPKAVDTCDEIKSTPSSEQMVRTQSQDGTSKMVGVLIKAPYIRPQHPKIMCPHCEKQPQGFRGTHELDRHIARVHSKVRKAFICIDASQDKRFLANCKHCRNKKVYGAYYNAAAHLRRAHFHPRKRGRKGKNDEKRGGSGGGDDPAMDYLRQNWIKEIEVANDATSADSTADDADDANDGDDSFEFNDYAATSYQQQPSTHNSSLDVNHYDQYSDPSMFVNSNSAFDQVMQFGGSFDPSSFHFEAEAYMD
ncbi:hypothetical protein BDV96DRAFT_597268 [Lophiotrema nucula]|uniref:DUF7896 domain-containing protein n=1 Tax=Lophiotrema nucula TaxID=690887 RepID=A0A6A5ZG29_9PLEO|nr:hypothetical protein BDV96DRAFT_597268 [Lophiotrema nucula]